MAEPDAVGAAINLQPLLLEATGAAIEAGSFLVQAQGNVERSAIRSKSAAVDLVSSADHHAERTIQRRLVDTAGFGFIGEESALPELWQGNYYWCVDPLDGTSNYLCGLPIWCVSIALVTSDYSPLLGVVHAPVLGKTWTAVRGSGAFCNGVPVQVRREPPGGGLQNAMLATGFPYDVTTADEDTNVDLYCTMQRHFQKIRRLGSAAIDLAYVADGTFDGMWELKLRPWDSAAGVVLVREAGGLLCQLDGNPYSPGDPSVVASATPILLDRILSLIGSAA
jgi:myo-inositol-1(or 4)-monophosphatase